MSNMLSSWSALTTTLTKAATTLTTQLEKLDLSLEKERQEFLEEKKLREGNLLNTTTSRSSVTVAKDGSEAIMLGELDVPSTSPTHESGIDSTSDNQIILQLDPNNLPWDLSTSESSSADTDTKSTTLRTDILALSQSQRTFTTPPPHAIAGFDLATYLPLAQRLLILDPMLSKQRFELVPKRVQEWVFWRNYFYRVNMLRMAVVLGVESTAGEKSGEVEGGANGEGKEKSASKTEIMFDAETAMNDTDNKKVDVKEEVIEAEPEEFEGDWEEELKKELGE